MGDLFCFDECTEQCDMSEIFRCLTGLWYAARSSQSSFRFRYGFRFCVLWGEDVWYDAGVSEDWVERNNGGSCWMCSEKAGCVEQRYGFGERCVCLFSPGWGLVGEDAEMAVDGLEGDPDGIVWVYVGTVLDDGGMGGNSGGNDCRGLAAPSLSSDLGNNVSANELVERCGDRLGGCLCTGIFENRGKLRNGVGAVIRRC